MLEILINIGKIISPIFYKLLYMSIIGTILGILILMLTKLFDSKISAKWKCLMWAIPIIFLIIPIQRIEVKTNNNIPMISAVDKVEEIFINVEPMEYETIEINNKSNNEKTIQLEETYNPTNKKQDTKDIILYTIVPLLWLLGSIIGIAIFIISNISLISKIRKTEKLKDYRIKAIQKIKSSPCIYGIMHPKILVPEDFAEKEDEIIENVFMHELSHYKRKDMITNCILIIMTAIHWFNPFVYRIFRNIRQEMELATDEIALSKMNKDEKRKYGLTLINLLQTYQSEPIEAKMLCITDDSKNMEKRIIRIKNSGRKAHKIISILSVLIIAIITLPFIVQATNTINYQPDIKSELKKVINNERSFITEGGYEVLFKDYEIIDGKYEINSFTYIDLDDDGVEELVTLISDYLVYMIFHYEEGNIYGYMLGIHMFEELKTDGTFMGSSGSNDNEYLRISFDKNTYKLENIAITEQEFEKKENNTFTKYNKTINAQNENVQDGIINELEGKWIPTMAMRNGEKISLREIYGSGIDIYQGSINFDSINGTYTKYIGIYSEDNVSDLQGTYEIDIDGVYLTSYSRNVTRLEYAEENMLLEQLDDGTFVYFKKYNSEYLDYLDKLNLDKGE